MIEFEEAGLAATVAITTDERAAPPVARPHFTPHRDGNAARVRRRASRRPNARPRRRPELRPFQLWNGQLEDAIEHFPQIPGGDAVAEECARVVELGRVDRATDVDTKRGTNLLWGLVLTRFRRCGCNWNWFQLRRVRDRRHFLDGCRSRLEPKFRRRSQEPLSEEPPDLSPSLVGGGRNQLIDVRRRQVRSQQKDRRQVQPPFR